MCLELEISIQKEKNIMKFLMLPSKDSKTGKRHNLDKFWVWYPKWNTELCFPYKKLPKFFQTVDVRTGWRRSFATCVVCRLVRACLPNSSVPMERAPCVHVRLFLMNIQQNSLHMSSFLQLLKATGADKCIMYGQHR